MYALAICGSPHKRGNTALLLGAALEPLIQQGWETEIFPLAGKHIRGCNACGQCIKKRDRQCAIKTDCLNEEILPRLFRADAILIGSPTYFAGITLEMKAVIDRAGRAARRQDRRCRCGGATRGARLCLRHHQPLLPDEPDGRPGLALLEFRLWHYRRRSGKRCGGHGQHARPGGQDCVAWASAGAGHGRLSQSEPGS